MGERHEILQYLEIPDFKDFILQPRNQSCEVIESTRIIVEVLWGLLWASEEIKWDEFERKVLIDWGYALIFRYQREQDGKYRPAAIVWFDYEETTGKVVINQVQWTKDNKVAFRFNSSFNLIAFLSRLMSSSFTRKWIPVEVAESPTWVEWASYASGALEKYRALARSVST